MRNKFGTSSERPVRQVGTGVCSSGHSTGPGQDPGGGSALYKHLPEGRPAVVSSDARSDGLWGSEDVMRLPDKQTEF